MKLYTWLVVSTPPKKNSQLDDDIPNWMESRKIHVPNHQPVMVDKTIEVTYLYGEHN